MSDNASVKAGVTQLAYLQFEVRDLAAWESFGTAVLGLEVVARRADGAFALRMDGHAARLFVTPGAADDLACLGWGCADAAALELIGERLRAAGVAVRAGTAEECEARRVRGLLSFVDPAGNPTEVSYGSELATQPFRSEVVRAGFVADEQGLGHIVISANTQAESTRFYEDVLGFCLSDHIRCEVHGFRVDIAFFHANARHHTVAFGDRQRKRMHHFMVEARSLDDVGHALDRTMAAGLRVMQTLGRHPNDRMVSFYAKTPSGFQFEFGWGGRAVDDATWTPTTYDHISEWGHHPPEFLAKPSEKRPGSA